MADNARSVPAVLPATGDAVLIRWRDATGGTGWCDYSDVPDEPVEIISVGILWRSDERALTIVTSQSDDQVNGFMVIPADWVTSVRVLKRSVAR